MRAMLQVIRHVLEKQEPLQGEPGAGGGIGKILLDVQKKQNSKMGDPYIIFQPRKTLAEEGDIGGAKFERKDDESDIVLSERELQAEKGTKRGGIRNRGTLNKFGVDPRDQPSRLIEECGDIKDMGTIATEGRKLSRRQWI